MALASTKTALRYTAVLSLVLVVLVTIRFTINFSFNSGVVVHQLVAQMPFYKMKIQYL